MYKQRFERYLCMLLAGLPKVYGYLTSNYAELGDAKLLYKLAPEVRWLAAWRVGGGGRSAD